MKIALFGGSGFVGKKALEFLRAAQMEVTEISRSPLSSPSYTADVTQLNSLMAIKENFDGVVICSSKLPQREYFAADVQDFFAVNVNGVANILEWSATRGVKKVVYCSTLSFLPFTDSTSQELLDTGSHYVYKVSKAAGEHLLMGYCKEKKLEYVSLRIGSVYGPGMKKDVLYAFYHKILNSDTIVIQNSNVTADFVHVDDVARSIVYCCGNHCSSIVNVASGKPVRLFDLVHLMAKVLNHLAPSIEIKSSETIPSKKYSAEDLEMILSSPVPLEVGLRELMNTW